MSPKHCVEVNDGLVRIYSLNPSCAPVQFPKYPTQELYREEGRPFAAEDELRWAIRFTLEPEKYLNGYGGVLLTDKTIQP